MQAERAQPQSGGLYSPDQIQPIAFEGFSTLNTNSTRPGIKDDEMWWCDGFMPVGPNYLRTLPGIGASIFTAPAGGSIVFFDFFNIGSTPYCFAVHSDGGLWQINTNTSVATRIAADGTITNPSRAQMGITQWGRQYLLIVASQTNGYWIWDGSNLYTSGTLGPQVTITDGGRNYSNNPTISASGGSGTGATFSATVANGVITKITITNPGHGYVLGDTPTISITDGTGTGATATVTIMPFGVSGQAAETYNSQVWISNLAQITFSAPGSVSNFATANGGGSFPSTDSFLRVSFTQPRQSNGFLYLIADSSVNYISGVQTSGSPAVTTFTNQNADPEIGTPYAATVDVFSRNILFANAFGAHVSYGGAVTKISDNLDGVYNSVPNFGGFAPSAAKAIIYGKKVWMVLLPVIDIVTGQRVNKLFMWNGKQWWSSMQDVPLIFVQHQEINSVITAFGTDGNKIYPLFQTPSVTFSKTVQSKLFSKPMPYSHLKTADRLWGIVQYFNASSPDLTVSIDNENGSAESTYDITPNVVTCFNNAGNVVLCFNNVSQQVTIFSVAVGIVVFPPTAIAQTGVLLGLTITTNSADVALISLMIAPQVADYRG
ncbi:MAG: hypothetical protein KGL39_49975 [Patescibacteria group bacterium]|nr:hypothetical protein [Patescibacteria group bacterium]